MKNFLSILEGEIQIYLNLNLEGGIEIYLRPDL